MAEAATAWHRCACGTLVADRHLAAMTVRACPACGSRNLAPASEHQARLADAGAVRITRLARQRASQAPTAT